MSEYDDWDVEYCNRRLRECVLFHKNSLWNYRKAREGKEGRAMIDFERLIDKQINSVPVKEVNLAVPKFGFTNLLDRSSITSMFIARTAIRDDWRQGIRARQLRADNGPIDHRTLFEIVDNIKSFTDTLNNKFIPLAEAIFHVEEEFDKVALSRNFAMDSNFKIYYQNEGIVGVLNAEDRIKLKEPYNKFLKEHVKAELNMEVIV
jgi:hypothetical protein